MDPNTVELTSILTKNIAEVTFEWVTNKLKAAKEVKDIEALRNTYEEIINSLVRKNSEVTRVAQEYKVLYDRVNISDQDIEYLQSTLEKILNLLTSSGNSSVPSASIEIVKQIVNKETLKTMQLLGFNYKEAIGEPLTEVCSTMIRKKFELTKNSSNKTSQIRNK
ncbi:MAG: hypothetical protein JXR88_04180 [Clostridia bacterium]|nr:hypothetical protein [Clostridia bacterium]